MSPYRVPERYYRGLFSRSLEFIVLALLNKEPSYGYELSENIGQRFGSTSVHNIYPLLKNMREDNIIRVLEGEDLPKHKVIYEITEKGKEKLKDYKEAFQDFVKDMNKLTPFSEE